MSGRFINSAGVVSKSRRQAAAGDSVGEPSLQKLHELVKSLYRRVQELEAKVSPEYMEQEFLGVVNDTTLTIEHGFDCPVRFWVTHMSNDYSAAGARNTSANQGAISLNQQPSSTSKTLVLKAYVTGAVNPAKVVVRVEPSQHGVRI